MADPHTPSAAWRLSLVIPAFNEEAGIRRAVAEADDALAALTADYEVIVVDDGSRDGTADAVRDAMASRPRVRLLRHESNRGYGAALRTGFEAARLDRVAFTDADCQFHLADLDSLLRLTDDSPLAVGYRLDRQDTRLRRFVSKGYNLMARALLGTRVRDCDCALKVFRREALAELLPESSGFFVNTEMLARARQRGYRVAEAGVRHRPRREGSSKVSPRDVPRVLKALLPFWWGRVLFPGVDGGGSSPERRAEGVGAFVLLAVMATLLFFARPGCPLQEPQEARYAEIPRQMLAEGSWVVPVLHGQPYTDKPPLFYWLVMLTYRLFGVHDWAARLVPGACGVLTVLLAYAWGRRTLGGRAAFLGALVLCLSARFVYLGRQLTPDAPLTACLVAALAAAHLAVRGPVPRRGWWLASALACGLGLLTKGPVALALVVPPVFAYATLDPRAARPRLRGWLIYLIVAGGVAAPWYAAMARAVPGFAGDFFWHHHVERFLTPFDHQEPLWYYLPGLLLGMLPWSLLLPGLARFLSRHSSRQATRRPAALGFFLLASLWGVLFFSASGCKRPAYVLPAVPALALALGCYLDVLLTHQFVARVGSLFARRAAAFALRAAQLVLGLGLGLTVAAVAVGLLKRADGFLLGCAAAAGLFGVTRPALRPRPRLAWGVCVAATFAVLFVGLHELMPDYARRFSLRGQVRSVAAVAADETVPVACYPRRWDSVSFYLGRDDVQAFTPARRPELLAALRGRRETLLFAKPGAALDGLLAELPPGMEFVPRGRQGSLTVGCVRYRLEAPAGLYAAAEPSVHRNR